MCTASPAKDLNQIRCLSNLTDFHSERAFVFPRQRSQHHAREFGAQAILTRTTTKENIYPVGCHLRGSNIGALLRVHS